MNKATKETFVVNTFAHIRSVYPTEELKFSCPMDARKVMEFYRDLKIPAVVYVGCRMLCRNYPCPTLGENSEGWN